MRMSPAPAILLVAFFLFAHSPSASADVDQILEERLDRELRSRNPAAADTFARANAAKALDKHEEAATLYGRVNQMVPDFPHAWRRKGYEFYALGLRTEAIASMRTAMALDPSPRNMVGLATALAEEIDSLGPSELEIQEAVRLVRSAEQVDPGDVQGAFLSCQLAIRAQDDEWLGTESARFERLAPQNPWAHFAVAIHLAQTGDPAGARRRLQRAKALGLPEATYTALLAQLGREGPDLGRLARVGGFVLAGWLAGFLVLLVLGSILSQVTLAASRRVPETESGGAVGLDATLRKAYRWVLWTCCAYYYISIPLVIATVLVVGGGLTYLMLMVGHIPIKLLLLVIVLTVVTLYAILKSLFIRGRDEDPGLKMEPGEAPRLRKVLDQVAAKIGTRAVTNVYLTPGAEMAVMERGGAFGQLRGHPERCLILGVGALEGMKLRPFRAVLAHEYGHFSNRDTAGGGFALTVRRSLVTAAVHLAHGGAATWFNPAWLFVNGFYRLFLRVSQGASRLQEVLADRWAAFSYGACAFKEGLRHIIDRSIRFDAHANSVLKEVIEGKKPLANLYSYRPSTELVEEPKLAEAVEEAINRAPSPYDSHPRPADRFAWVDALGSAGGPEEPDDNQEAWTLFDGRESLEQRLTDYVRQNLTGQGIAIRKHESDPVEEGPPETTTEP